MMNKVLLIILLATLNLNAFSQQYTKQEKIERLKAQKVAFITDKLNLTTEEAQNFWPLYNEFFKQKEKISSDKKQITIDLRQNWKNYSKKEKTELADKLIQFRVKEANLEQEYHEKFKTVLDIDKVIMLYNAETQFKNYLLKQIRSQSSINEIDRPAKRK